MDIIKAKGTHLVGILLHHLCEVIPMHDNNQVQTRGHTQALPPRVSLGSTKEGRPIRNRITHHEIPALDIIRVVLHRGPPFEMTHTAPNPSQTS